MKAKIESALLVAIMLPYLLAIWVYLPLLVVTKLLVLIGVIDPVSSWALFWEQGALGYAAGYPALE
jgi:hypothetical protein